MLKCTLQANLRILSEKQHRVIRSKSVYQLSSRALPQMNTEGNSTHILS